jgi:hypothetical protein
MTFSIIPEGWEEQKKFAQENGVDPRTMRNYRNKYGWPFVMFAGLVYIDTVAARADLRARAKRRNPPRVRSSKLRSSREATATA